MPNGIRLGVAADTREFDRGIKQGVIDPLEDATDALRDLAKDGDRAGSDLERSMRDQQDETKKLEREYRDLADTIKSSSRKAGRDIDDGIGDGLDKAGDGLNDFKDEAKGTAREGAASFSGEWTDVGDVVQETLANALAGFGPIGAAAGIAAAVGFGTLLAQVEKDAEAAEARVGSMYESFLESGLSYITEEQIQSKIQEIAGDTDLYADALSKAADLGVDVSDVLRALAGDTSTYNAILRKGEDNLAAMEKEQQKNIDAGKGLDSVLQGQIDAQYKANNAWREQSAEMQKAKEKADQVREALRGANNQLQDAALKAAGLRKQLVQLPNDQTISVTLGVNETKFNERVNRALNNARALASKGIAVDFQVTRNGTKVY